MVKSITAGAGSIQSGDVMVKIENDDVTNMPLLRGTATSFSLSLELSHTK